MTLKLKLGNMSKRKQTEEEMYNDPVMNWSGLR